MVKHLATLRRPYMGRKTTQRNPKHWQREQSDNPKGLQASCFQLRRRPLPCFDTELVQNVLERKQEGRREDALRHFRSDAYMILSGFHGCKRKALRTCLRTALTSLPRG